jgi:hypothetical protein
MLLEIILKKVENSLALKLARSTTAPVIRAGVIMAKVAWYIQYTVAGMVPAYLLRSNLKQKQCGRYS